MRIRVAFTLLAAVACSPRAGQTAAMATTDRQRVTELANDVFAAARSRDAARFASYFSDRADFIYLINTRQLTSRDSLRATFAGMLSRQARFEPVWRTQHVQILSDNIAVVTGLFETTAERVNGEQWKASGVITIVAMKERAAWRVVNWHTTE